MAKIAKVGYGSDGRGVGNTDGYVYIVNDTVRAGDVLQVVATSRLGRKFATTGKTLHAYKEDTVKGIETKVAGETAMNPANNIELTKAYSAKELGVSGFKGRTQKETQELAEYNALPASEKKNTPKPQTQYTEMVRAGNLAKYVQANPSAQLSKNAEETFDSYSQKFMKGE